MPSFNFSGWNPDPPAGINFLGLLPMRSGYQLANEQHIHQGKLTISAQHRQQRRKNFSRCATFGKNVIGELLHNISVMQLLFTSVLKGYSSRNISNFRKCVYF